MSALSQAEAPTSVRLHRRDDIEVAWDMCSRPRVFRHFCYHHRHCAGVERRPEMLNSSPGPSFPFLRGALVAAVCLAGCGDNYPAEPVDARAVVDSDPGRIDAAAD